MYTVKQLSTLAGVSVRTLHYYDEIGLLKPSTMGENGYRYYAEEALIRLQQILFYRELDLSLEDIKHVITHPGFDVLEALTAHRQALGQRVERLNRLITTVDKTISHLKGKSTMNSKGLFEGFTEEEQEKYAQEAAQRYDSETVKASNKKWKSYSAAEKQRIMDEGNQIYADMIDAMPKGADSAEVQAIVERWRIHMDYFWTPNLDQLLGLADGYNTDPSFKANFDKIDPRLAEFMKEAVGGYVRNGK